MIDASPLGQMVAAFAGGMILILSWYYGIRKIRQGLAQRRGPT